MKVIRFAINIGFDDILIPYTIHAATPVKNIIKVVKETSSAFFVCNVLINCGIKAKVVRIAAK